MKAITLVFSLLATNSSEAFSTIATQRRDNHHELSFHKQYRRRPIIAGLAPDNNPVRPFTATTTALGPVAPDKIIDPFSYRERLRMKRRDFYTQESWLRHRSKDRFLGTLVKMLESGLIRSLKDELIVGR